MKLGLIPSVLMVLCRAPQGARGLKPYFDVCPCVRFLSRPPGGAWIETNRQYRNEIDENYVAPPRGRVD